MCEDFIKISSRFHEEAIANSSVYLANPTRPRAMSNAQMNTNRRDSDKKKRQLQQQQTQFKQHWAIYQAKQQATQLGVATTYFGVDPSQGNMRPPQPSFDAILLETVQKIWMRRGTFAPPNLANVFLQQTANMTYADYKQALVRYLWTAIAEEKGLEPLKQKIEETLAQLWTEQDKLPVDNRLRLRTCNRLISLITTQGNTYPSPMFTLLAVQEQYDIFGLMLLRLMLINRPSYQYFADAMDTLTDYYATLQTPKSHWIVSFLEIFKMNITEYLDRDFQHKIDFTPQQVRQYFQ